MNGVFISFAGIDIIPAEELRRSLPDGLIQIYTHSFIDGKTLLSEMRRLVQNCNAFVLLASSASLQSVWCNYEISLGEIEHVRRAVPVFVMALDARIGIEDIPQWMKAFWTSKSSGRLPLLKRRLQDIAEQHVLMPVYSGHMARAEKMEREYLEHVSLHDRAPNAFMISGVDSIGRHTTAKLFMQSRLGNRRFSNGPLVKLQDPASLEDLYMQLNEDLNGITSNDYEGELLAYRAASFEAQVDGVDRLISTICADDETVYIECRSGAFDENGYLIDWARCLIEASAQHSRTRLVFISTRQPRRHDIAALPNLMHSHIISLTTDEIKGLVRDITLRVSGRAMTPEIKALSTIGGHPVLAKHYASSIVGLGEALEDESVYEVIMQQKTLFSGFLSYNNLNEDQRDMLSVLSWIPHADANLLDEIFLSIPINNYKVELLELHLSSLVEYNSGRYAISGPVRHIFRQLYGDGSKETALKVASALAGKISDQELLSREIIDLTTYLLLLFSGDLPAKVRAVLSPSTLLRSARTLYQRSRERATPPEYERVINLCEAALNLTAESTLQRDLSAVKARSLLRLRRYEEANEVIVNLESSGGRQALNLRAQYYRFKGEYRQALPLYRTLIGSGINDESVLHEYCLCLRKVGEIEEVRRVIDRYDDKVVRSVYLLRTKVSLELGSGKFRAAEKTITAIRKLIDKSETAAEKEAVLLAKESQNYAGALSLLNTAIDRVEVAGNDIVPDLHSTRCLIYCKMRSIREARIDMNIVRSKHRDGDFVAKRLSIHILIAEKRYPDALMAYDQLNDKTVQDSPLYLEVINDYIANGAPSFSEKARLERLRATTIASSGLTVTEYDF